MHTAEADARVGDLVLAAAVYFLGGLAGRRSVSLDLGEDPEQAES